LIAVSDSKLNFKLINSNLSNVFIESELILGKLYKKSLSNLINLNYSSDQYFYLNVLSKVDFTYFINIMFGTLLLIITNFNIQFNFTSPTEVCYNLGTDLIKRFYFNHFIYNYTEIQLVVNF